MPGIGRADEPHSALDSAPSVDSTAKQTPAGPETSPSGITPKAADQSPAAPDTMPVLPETQTGYVYDLKKLIIKSRENIKRVNEKIKDQAVIKRNQKREERAREYYQRGLQLTQEGKLDEAREYFEKAIRITEHPEMTRYIQQSESRLKAQDAALKREERDQVRQQEAQAQTRQQEAQQAYEEAVRFYREKKFREAKDAFEHVEELAPDYKAVRSYLRVVDQDIIAAETLAQKAQRVEVDRQQKEAEAARQREKETWKKEMEQKEKERVAQVNTQAQEVYEQAVALYKQKKFADAKKKFQDVEWVIPDYKATRNYLGRMDRDIAEEQKRLDAEKAKAMAQQQWDEEVARRKRQAEDKRLLEQKEKERLAQLQDQAGFLYQAAVMLFDKKLLDDALEKFNDIEKTVPGFKSTRVYISKIALLKEQYKREEQEQVKRKAEAEAKAKRDGELERQRQEEAMAKQERHRLEEAAEVPYAAGVALFDHRRYADAKAKFTEAAAKVPDYKRLPYYLGHIDDLIQRQNEEQEKEGRRRQVEAERQKVMADVQHKIAMKEGRVLPPLPPQPPKAPPAAVEVQPVAVEAAPAVSVPAVPTKEQEVQEAEDIAELAQKSSRMYQQIAALANDRRMAPAKKKMAQVDQVLTKLKNQKEELLRQIRAEEERARQKELKERQEAALARTAQEYDEAIMLLRNKAFEDAKAKFQEIEGNSPNFRATRQYLSRIDQDRRRAEQEAAAERTHAEEKHAKELEEKRRVEEAARKAAEEERLRKLKQAQEEEISGLADKAAILNDDILRATQQRDFKAAKEKFADLEKVLASLRSVKDSMEDDQHRRERQRAEQAALQAQAEAAPKRAQEIPKAREVKTGHERSSDEAGDIGRAGQERARKLEVQNERNALVLKDREARRNLEEVYRHGVELYGRKKYSAAKLVFDDLAAHGDRRAAAYARKIEHIVQEQERALKGGIEKERSDFLAEQRRQQRLARIAQEKEVSHQKEMVQALARQKRLAENERLQERSRREELKVQEQDRQHAEQERKRLEVKDKEQQQVYGFRRVAPAGSEAPPAKPQALAPVPAVPSPAPPALSEVELTPQQRQEQVKISNERKKFLEVKYQKEQQEKQLKSEEEKRVQVIKDRKEQASAEKERKAEAARQVRERAKQLAVERAQAQKKLAAAAGTVYADAMRLYKAGRYSEAAGKFQDIEDILPDYKQARAYARKALAQAPRSPAAAPAAATVEQPVRSRPVVQSTQPAVRPASRDEAIQKTLDIFDSN